MMKTILWALAFIIFMVLTSPYWITGLIMAMAVYFSGGQ